MDFSISDELQSILDRARAFMHETVLPAEQAILLDPAHADVDAAMVPIRAKAKAEGLWLPQLPKAHGGMGLSVLEHGLLSEVLGHSPLGHYALNCQAPDAGNMELMLEYASRGQRSRWLDPILAGDIRSCFAMTEPEFAGSNPTRMGTRAVLEGENWRISGHKWFCTGADGAAVCIVMAVTDPDAARHARATMFIVPMDAPGVRHVRNVSIMGDSGNGWASHAELEFNEVEVGPDAILGMPGAGFLLAQARLGPGRIHHCMRWIGVCERAFSMMCERARSRVLDEGKPLAHKQTIHNWIAESRAEIDAARLSVLHAAWKMDRVGARNARVEISAIKFFVADVMMKVIDRAVQVHGALGISDDTILSFFYRHERGARIYDGPDEVHKTVVARAVLAGGQR